MVDPGAPTVFFVSDYGVGDEFVGVVHAVIRRVAPSVAVIDLSHNVAPFDVRAGADLLVRAVPHLGRGVVLAVVDPGVGTARRGVLIETRSVAGPGWFVGPDNGLLVAGAEMVGGIQAAWTLRRPDPQAPGARSVTFDGRDVFAPAAAALAGGADPSALGVPLALSELIRLRPALVEIEERPGDGGGLRAEVSSVDRFGNVQLAARGDLLAAVGDVSLVVHPRPVAPLGSAARSEQSVRYSVRSVRAFADLDPGALGVLSDANGRLAVVMREGSAADHTGVAPGDIVELSW